MLINKTMERVALLGDSVLDNFYWLEDKKNDLTNQLSLMGYEVGNFAVDESQVKDVLRGCIPRDVYSNARHYPYPVNSNGKVIPLKLVADFNPNVSVLSIGGNDVRVHLTSLMWGFDNFKKNVLEPLRENYNKVIIDLKSKSNKVILVSFYLPYMGPGSIYSLLSLLGPNLANLWTDFFFSIAKEHDLPVINLSSTFDPKNRAHYGSTEIEPSNFSSQCIADLIQYVNNNYDNHKIYSAPNCNMSNITIS